MDTKAREIKYLPKDAQRLSIKVSLCSPGLSHNIGEERCLMVIWAALAEPQRLSPVEQRGEFTGLQQESGSRQGSRPGALFLLPVALPSRG